MEKQYEILIDRIDRNKSGLNYVQSISENALELDNYYKEREILYQENAKQEEIVLRPAPITDLALLAKPPENDVENLFYFGAQCQINREIRRLEDSIEAKERHLRAKARRQPRKNAASKETRKPIKLRHYSAEKTKKSTSTTDSDQLALPSTATLALPSTTDTPTPTRTPTPKENKKQKRKIQIRTQVPKKTKISRKEIPKEKKTVEEIMMAHLPTLTPNIKKSNGPKKIILIDKALPSSAPPIRKKRRRLASKSDSKSDSKKVKNNLENVSKLNDHGSVFDQFGECPVPPQEPIEELPPSPPKDKPPSTPKRNDPIWPTAESQSQNQSSFECHAEYHADFEDSDTETPSQNDSLLSPSETSPASPIFSSTPEPIIPPDSNKLDILVSTDSGKESNESIEVRSSSLELPPVSSREPSPPSETSTPTTVYIPNLALFDSGPNDYFNKFLEDSEDDARSTNEESDDCIIVATGNRYAPEVIEVITLDDSDAEVEAIDTGPEGGLIAVKLEEKKAVLGEIEIDAWLDAKRLPVGFSYQVGQKVKYGEFQYKISNILSSYSFSGD